MYLVVSLCPSVCLSDLSRLNGLTYNLDTRIKQGGHKNTVAKFRPISFPPLLLFRVCPLLVQGVCLCVE